MTVPTDPYNFTNGSTADGDQVDARFAPLYAALSGALDVDNVLDAILEKLALSDGATIRRGKSIIATTESRTNTAYGTLTTPDQVAGIVLPTDGQLWVFYQATWQESVLAAARAALFLGSNQVKIAQGGATTAPVVQEATVNTFGGGVAARDIPLVACAEGVVSSTAQSNYTGDVTTGQILGVSTNGTHQNNLGPCVIAAAAGTYTVSMQFKSSSGSVTVKNRKLWVMAIGF